MGPDPIHKLALYRYDSISVTQFMYNSDQILISTLSNPTISWVFKLLMV